MHEASKPGILGHLMILRTGILEYFEASRINKKNRQCMCLSHFFILKKPLLVSQNFVPIDAGSLKLDRLAKL